MAKAPAKKEKGGGGKKGSSKALGYLLAPAIAIVAYPTLIVALGGMIPTIVAYIVDNREERFAAKTVGYLNGAGVFFVVSEMWVGEHTWQKALELLSDPFNWLLMFGMASLGWILYFALPPIVAAYLKVANELKLKQLNKDQARLIKEWGDDVARNAPPIPDDFNQGAAGAKARGADNAAEMPGDAPMGTREESVVEGEARNANQAAN